MSSNVGNIFGEGFPDEIVKQVAERQKVYASGIQRDVRSIEDVQYLNSNTAFIKLLSSVRIKTPSDVNGTVIKDLNLSGDNLAKKFVLFGGITELKGTELTSSMGISFENTLSGNNAAYGMGGNDFGIRPMPGIVSATINHENRGSLRRAEVKIKAYNRAQFEILDVLYLRVGFHILLEWGHTLYLDSGGTLQYMNGSESLQETFLNGGKTYEQILKEIAQRRLTYSGNYDAMLGKVTNFQWTFNPDGSYDITVKISSIGDIIESLKANILIETAGDFTSVKKEKKDEQQNLDELDSDELIEKFSSKHTIGAFLYFMKFYLASPVDGLIPKTDLIPDFIEEGLANNPLVVTAVTAVIPPASVEYPTPFSLYRSRVLDLTSINPAITVDAISAINAINGIQKTVSNVIKSALLVPPATIYGGLLFALYGTESIFNKLPTLVNIDPNSIKKNPSEKHYDGLFLEWDNWGDEYYIRLGTFLEFIEKVILIQAISGGSNKTPLLRFDTTSKKNIMFAPKGMIGVDPRICVVNRESWGAYNGNLKLENAPGGEEFICYTATTSNEYGDLMNIYLNMGFILKKIDETKDDQGRITLIDLLQGLLKGVNTSFSGVPDLDVFIDETTNTVKIIDKNPLPDLDEIIKKEGLSDKKAIFSLYGYSTINGENQAGFIHDFNLTSELTPEFSTMVTVGAAANSAVVGENDTALSKINIGLEDRYKEKVTNGSYDPAAAGHAAADLSRTISDLENKIEKIKLEYYNFLLELSPSNGSTLDDAQELNKEDVDVYKETLKTIYEMQNQIEAGKAKLAGMLTYKKYQPKGTGFIPFNLSLTMNGLAGMKINQQFYIDTAFLPSNYPDAVRFLIKNLSHTIESNKWTTRMESYCIANGKEEKSLVTPANVVVGGGGGGGNNGGGGGVTNTNITGSGGNNIITNTTSSVQDCDNSPIRQAIIKKAKEYYNLGAKTKEIQFYSGSYVDKKGITRPLLIEDQGWKDQTFQKEMQSVGWQKNQMWCNYFSDLVWREAYKEVSATDSCIDNAFKTTLKGKVIPPLTAGVFRTAIAARDAGFGVVFSPGDTWNAGILSTNPRFEMPRPGDMVIYASGHVNIAVEVDYIKKTWKTIGGNEGGKVSYDDDYWHTKTVFGIVRVVDPCCTGGPNITVTPPFTSVAPANGCITVVNAAPIDIYTPTNLSGSYLDVTRNLSDTNRRLAITNFGWPIQVEQFNGRYYAKMNKANMHTDVGGTSPNASAERRPLLYPCPEYMRNNLGTLSYTDKTGRVRSFANLHTAAIPALRDTLTDIENQGLLDYLETIYSGMYTRTIRNVKQKDNRSYDILSFHGFGLASDINSDTFPIGTGGKATWESYILKDVNSKEYKLARVVQIFGESGRFYWGKDIPDYHHMVVNPYRG
jgi:hypothetical protein